MADNKYEIINVRWETANIMLQIIKIPEEEIEERLELLSGEPGVSKIEYESFIITKCLLDIDRLGRWISTHSKDTKEDQKYQDELVQHIIDVNPLLNPELLFIDDKNIIKFPSDDTKGYKRLVENQRWEKDFINDLLEDFKKFDFYL